jgi:hypothetical protein
MIFRIGALALVLSLLVTALSASPALAYAEEIELDPEEGEIGDEIDITGNDFDESYYDDSEDEWDYVYVAIYFFREEVDEGDDIDDVENYEILDSSEHIDEDGEFDISFDVPDELTDGEDDEEVYSGTYYVAVTYKGDDEIVAIAEFTVLGAEIELDPDDGPVGTEVEITGIDFADDEDITVEYDGDEVDIESGDDGTDSRGEFECTIVVPESTADEHTITVTDDSGVEAEAEFTVEASIAVEPDRAAPGDSVTVSGTGFGDSVDFTVNFDGDEVITSETGGDGSFEFSFKVPTRSSGSYAIEAEDDDGNEARADFTIEAGIQLSQTTGNVGDTFTISGSGFTPNASVTITLAGAQTTASTDGRGRFSANITVPGGQSGPQVITASDGVNTMTSTFTVESTPPQVPVLLSPVEAAKADSLAYFDWSDVTDPSGVTYTLQIAADANFTVMVLEKTGLAESQYGLTEVEKLKSTSKESPYYWRVRAIDGAENASDWTTRRSFNVGSTFFQGFQGWVRYTVIGVFVALVVLIIYLLRTRTASQ